MGTCWSHGGEFHMVPHVVAVTWRWGAGTFTAMSSTWAGKPPTAVARPLSLPPVAYAPSIW